MSNALHLPWNLEQRIKGNFSTLSKRVWLLLKGLGHAILGNFSIDQMVIELTEITK